MFIEQADPRENGDIRRVLFDLANGRVSGRK
jgi:hypothetical protein